LGDFDAILNQVQDDGTVEARDLSTLQPFNFSTFQLMQLGNQALEQALMMFQKSMFISL
jgi:hypothetical protein